jgi:hypothetical protein
MRSSIAPPSTYLARKKPAKAYLLKVHKKACRPGTNGQERTLRHQIDSPIENGAIVAQNANASLRQADSQQFFPAERVISGKIRLHFPAEACTYV